MTIQDTAIINKAKQEMKLWVKTYILSNKTKNSHDSLEIANRAIKRFNETFNETGNI